MSPDADLIRVLLVGGGGPVSEPPAANLDVGEGHAVLHAADITEAFRILSSDPVEAIIVDGAQQDCASIELVRVLHQEFARPIVFIANCDSARCVKQAADAGALAYLVKPMEAHQLRAAITQAMQTHAELERLRKTCDQLQTALNQERNVSIAIGITMCRLELERDAAFETLRRAARSGRRKLADLAEELVLDRGTHLKPTAVEP